MAPAAKPSAVKASGRIQLVFLSLFIIISSRSSIPPARSLIASHSQTRGFSCKRAHRLTYDLLFSALLHRVSLPYSMKVYGKRVPVDQRIAIPMTTYKLFTGFCIFFDKSGILYIPGATEKWYVTDMSHLKISCAGIRCACSMECVRFN